MVFEARRADSRFRSTGHRVAHASTPTPGTRLMDEIVPARSRLRARRRGRVVTIGPVGWSKGTARWARRQRPCWTLPDDDRRL